MVLPSFHDTSFSRHVVQPVQTQQCWCLWMWEARHLAKICEVWQVLKYSPALWRKLQRLQSKVSILWVRVEIEGQSKSYTRTHRHIYTHHHIPLDLGGAVLLNKLSWMFCSGFMLELYKLLSLVEREICLNVMRKIFICHSHCQYALNCWYKFMALIQCYSFHNVITCPHNWVSAKLQTTYYRPLSLCNFKLYRSSCSLLSVDLCRNVKCFTTNRFLICTFPEIRKFGLLTQ